MKMTLRLRLGFSLVLAPVAACVAFHAAPDDEAQSDAGDGPAIEGDGAVRTRPTEDDAHAGSVVATDGPILTCIPPSDAGTQLTKGGTRLRPIYLTSPDGLELFVGTRDTLLGIDCRGQVFPEDLDTWRCLPEFPSYEDFWTAYSDPGCSSQTVLIGPPNHAGEAIYLSSRRRVILGAALAPSVPVYINPGGNCQLVTGETAYTIAEAQGNDVFAQLSKLNTPLTATTDAILFAGEDGSEIYSGSVYDRVHRSVPHVATGSDGIPRWLPRAVEVSQLAHQTDPDGGGFTPATCKAQGDFASPSLGLEPEAGAVTLGSDPTDDPFFPWADGGPLPHDVRKAAMATADICVCPPSGDPYCFPFAGHLLGEALPPCGFELAGNHLGGTRLTFGVTTLAGIPVTPQGVSLPWRLRDEALGIECAPATDEEGVLRCLPLPYNWTSGLYLDATCAMPVVIDNPNGPPPDAFRYEPIGARPCGGTTKTWPHPGRVYSPGPAMPPPAALYWVNIQNPSCLRCEQVDSQILANLVANRTFFTVNTVVPTIYAPMTREVR